MESSLVHTYATYPFTIADGDGVYVHDEQGQTYLDLYGGHAVSILGHRPGRVIKAIEKQARTLFFYSNVAPLEIRERAAAKLVSFAGGGFSRVFFCNSGAEANESALKLAMQLTGRFEIAALTGAFHGRTALASAATDNAKWHAQLGPWMGPVARIAANDESGLEQVTEKTAAVIIEPIQSMAGVIELETPYLQALRQRCDRMGALLIFDEVQTGVGRTGVSYVGADKVQADMSTSAKSIASGFPLGAILMTPEVADRVQIGQMGSTFGGNPLAMAAMEATLDTLAADKLVDHAAELGRFARKCISPILGVEEIRGRGCLLGIKLRTEAKPLVGKLRERGILVGTSDDPSVMRILAPLIIETDHIQQFARELELLLQEANAHEQNGNATLSA